MEIKKYYLCGRFKKVTMKSSNLVYLKPECELVEIRTKASILSVSDPTIKSVTFAEQSVDETGGELN